MLCPGDQLLKVLLLLDAVAAELHLPRQQLPHQVGCCLQGSDGVRGHGAQLLQTPEELS